MRLLEAAREELRGAKEALREAEDAFNRGLYALSVKASERALERCLKASSRLIGSPWVGMGMAEHVKLIEDLIRRRGDADREITAEEARAELRRARELVEALDELLSELEEA